MSHRSHRKDTIFLYQRWSANGEQNDWENAYRNAQVLLEKSDFTEAQLITESQRRQQSGEASLFLRTTAHWEMRLIARLKKTHAPIQRAAFGALGNGCGISAISARYENQESFSDDRRYIFASNMDKKIGEQLIYMAHQAINAGADADVNLLGALVPGNWGFHRRDALLQANKNFDVMDVIVAEKAYLTRLERAVFLPQKEKIVTLKEALGRLKRFQAGTKTWLEESLSAYREKSIQDGSWYDAQGMYCQVTEKNLDKRVARYQEALKKSMESRVNWMKKHIKDGEYARLGELCQVEQVNLVNAIENAQANIQTMMKRSLALMGEIKQRFAILMSLTPHTKAIYEAYNEEDKKALDEEIREDNDAIAKRFISGYLQACYGDIQHQLKEKLTQARAGCFIAWIENADNQDLPWMEHWDAMRETWKNAESDDKDLLINAIKKNRFSAVKALFSTIFTAHETLAESFVEQLRDTESLMFNTSIAHYITEQSFEVKQAWKRLSIESKEAIYVAFKEGFDSPDAFKHIVATHPEIFSQPSIEYILRYLRFGLSVDACCENTQHQTLLFYALKRLGDFPEEHSLPQTNNFYRMIQHLVNVGATVCVQSDEATFKTPKAYVEHKCNLYPENTRWVKLSEVLDTVILWFELQKKSEERLNHLVNQLLEHVEYYDGHILNVSSIESIEDLLNKAGKALRSEAIENSRRASMDLVKETATQLLQNRFDLKDNLKRLQDSARNGERRIRMGRFNEGIYSRVEACIQNFEQSITTDASTLALYHSRASQAIQPSIGGQIMRFFGRGDLAPDSAEVRRLKAATALKDTAIKDRDSVIQDRDMVIQDRDSVIQAQREQIRNLLEEKQAEVEDSEFDPETKQADSDESSARAASPQFFQTRHSPTPESKDANEFEDGHNMGNGL